MNKQNAGQSSSIEYEVQTSLRRDAVWIHASDGSTVGRFGRMGIDLHNTVTEQMHGMPECRLCTHGKPSKGDWALFREKAMEWWGVEISTDAFDQSLLVESAGVAEVHY